MELREVFSVYSIYTLLHRLENNKRVRFRRSFWFWCLILSLSGKIRFENFDSKILVLFCVWYVTWFSTNAFFFRLFSTENTIFLDCMQPIVCFWSLTIAS